MTAAPLDRWRLDTPGCIHRTHLNNAGAALMPLPVTATMHAHLNLETHIGGYEAADARTTEVDAVYQDLARLINCDARNMAIVANATAGFIQALSSFDFKPGDVILTSKSDYTSYQIQYLALAKRLGVRVVHAPDLPEGGVDPDGVRDLFKRERPTLVSISWLPTHSGLIQDVHAVGDVCAEAGVPYHVDACQAVGLLPVDVERLRCDYLSATARKFLRGPRGIGFLYASNVALDRGDYPLFVDMRGAEWVAPDEFRVADSAKRYEDWEFPYALVLGLGAAARYALDEDVAVTGARALMLAQRMRDRLAAIPGMRILDPGREQSAIVTFAQSDRPAPELVAALQARKINTVVTRRWYGLLDFTERGVETAVRASPHYYNTEAEVDLLVDVVSESV